MEKIRAEEFDQLVRFFDGMAQTSWLSAVHDVLKQLTGSWEGKHVLDVGCATGRILLRGVDEAASVTGVDLAPAMVAAAKELYKRLGKKGTFQEADAYELPFSDDTYHLAISTCVLFLLPKPEIGMKEMLRVVKSGGMVVMLNPSQRMNPEMAALYCSKNNLTGFEEKTLKQWSNVSTSRHRYEAEELSDFLMQLGAAEVTHHEVLDGLAYITLVRT